MVTFNCEVCNDTVPKKNTEKHYYRCPEAYYTCIDCSKTFDDGVSYKSHTSCISEDEKYQKALYKGKKKQKQKQQPAAPAPAPAPAKKVEKVKKASNGIELHKGDSLYKILKTVKDKEAKKAFLKNLVVDSEGQIKYAKE
ncbi:YCR087C-A [Saccharomyces arboricola H-6]|uniref:YCR087C-A n=1 Tax=Saccharomyces arboricola (strain H-6 / AS 2.3317 / CBS 10644) TaxID=1160507 RepID=J8Q471_SACAR|nr:YCR087C-A [Saccharomyces arboricola H-6]